VNIKLRIIKKVTPSKTETIAQYRLYLEATKNRAKGLWKTISLVLSIFCRREIVGSQSVTLSNCLF